MCFFVCQLWAYHQQEYLRLKCASFDKQPAVRVGTITQWRDVSIYCDLAKNKRWTAEQGHRNNEYKWSPCSACLWCLPGLVEVTWAFRLILGHRAMWQTRCSSRYNMISPKLHIKLQVMQAYSSPAPTLDKIFLPGSPTHKSMFALYFTHYVTLCFQVQEHMCKKNDIRSLFWLRADHEVRRPWSNSAWH